LVGKKQNKFYYGSRYAKNCNPSDLFTKYFTSSKVVHKFIKEYGQPDIIQIRKKFKNESECRSWEHKVLRRLNVIHNDKFLNRTYKIGFSTEWKIGKKYDEIYPNGVSDKLKNKRNVAVRDKDGNTFCVYKDDPRLYTGELYVLSKEKTKTKFLVKDTETGKIFWVDKNDENLLNGKYSKNTGFGHKTKNTMPVYDKNGSCIRVNKDDPRIKTGELIPQAKYASIDTFWCTNGIINKRIKNNENIPESFYKGMTRNNKKACIR
jgi:hypothetical protein